jgi:hypothetical protein
MAFNSLQQIGDDFVDAEVINKLIANDKYLKEVSPTIHLIYSGGAHSTAQGDSIRISCGTVRIPKFKGTSKDIVLRFPAAPKGPGLPVLTLTPQISAPGSAYIVSYGPNHTTAKVRISLFNRTTSSTAILNWTLIHAL